MKIQENTEKTKEWKRHKEGWKTHESATVTECVSPHVILVCARSASVCLCSFLQVPVTGFELDTRGKKGK